MPYPSQSKNSLFPLVAGRQLSLADFQVVSVIGAGSSGSVYHVVDKATSRNFAMKVVPTGPDKEELALQEYISLREVAGAPFTVSLRGFFSDDINYYLLIDYFPYGNIYAQVDLAGKLTPCQVRYFIAELLVALEHTHSRNVIHLDVNPSNILVDEEGHIALADFGVSRSFGDGPTGSVHTASNPFITSRVCGTPAYNSPEVAWGKPYSFEADLWAVGVIMYQMLTHRLPFGLAECEGSRWGTSDAIRFVPLAVEDSDGIDKIAFDFMDRILKKDKKDRMSLEEMKNHIYFGDIDFAALVKRKSGRPFSQKVREPCNLRLASVTPFINPAYDPLAAKTYFVDNMLERTHPRLFTRLVARLGKFVGKSVRRTPPAPTPTSVPPSAVPEASINGNIHRRSRKPYFFEPLESGDDPTPATTPGRQGLLYPEPRFPSVMREEILVRRRSIGTRRRFSVIVDDDRLNEVPPIGFRKLGLARSGPAVWDLTSMVLSPVEEKEEEGGDGELEWRGSPHAVGLVRSAAVGWDLSSLV